MTHPAGASAAGTPAPDQEALQAAYALHADICKVLTDPKRLMILDALRHQELSVGELAERAGIRLTNASQHLGVLRHAGLVEARREATTIYYRLSEPRILDACDVVHGIVASRLGRAPRLAGGDSPVSGGGTAPGSTTSAESTKKVAR